MPKYKRNRIGDWRQQQDEPGPLLDMLLWLLAVGIPLAAGVVVAAALLGRAD